MKDPLDGYPGYLLRRASSLSMAKLSGKLAALELSPTEATVLHVIDANPNATQSGIGKLLDIASANMAPLVSRLEKRGLIARQRVDGRSHGLALTTRGQTLAERVRKIVGAHEAALIAKVPASQRAAFLATLRALQEAE
jgi:DNA-binding MarR family transcriptional regulator